MKTTLTKLIIPIYLISAALAPFALFAGAASADTLKGGVQEADIKKGDAPSLNRTDMEKGVDPFGGGEQKKDDDGGMLQAPPGSFDKTNTFEGTPKPFAMDATADGGGAPFNGQQGMPQMENNNNPPPNNGGGNAPLQGSSTTPNNVSTDPEESAAMQLLWDAWHKRVAETIYNRFNTSAQMLFKHSPPLACQVSYMVARDGRIGNVRVLQGSANPIFNTMLLTVIHSIAGNAVLEYPPNSKRQFVEKTGTFTWNYSGGQGFKYTVGDKETLQQRQQRGR